MGFDALTKIYLGTTVCCLERGLARTFDLAEILKTENSLLVFCISNKPHLLLNQKFKRGFNCCYIRKFKKIAKIHPRVYI